MEFYVCSTVRHLLFAVLRANARPQVQSHVVLFADYQGITPDLLDTEVLPDHIQVHLLSRRATSKLQSKTLTGTLFYFLAMRDLPAPARFRRHFCEQLASLSPALSRALLEADQPQMVLFNEKNKMARLFSRVVPQFSIIEDGEGNYRKLPVKTFKQLGRLLTGRTPSYKVFGESPRCRQVHLLTPERAPDSISHKAVKIDFLDPKEQSAMVLTLFRLTPPAHTGQREAVLSTQPIENIAGCGVAGKLTIYRTLIDALMAQGYQVYLKIHPAEDTDQYQEFAQRCTVLNAKVPLEAILLGMPSVIPAISILSAAGTGFEQHCHRLTLADTTLADTLGRWGSDPTRWQKALKQALVSVSND
ncbi:glycosyltransferase family 52 [Ferrimonas kyonanensis]|uniref:glycosyltransferase family 52 n=1 Tax=Ferrimonas kyonanensis TaxID=364763 RepID=UPI00041D367C|nr:glycosyltransferase family 52 [Ferrimonas kyonanensis]